MINPKKIETSNPLFILVEGEGMCEPNMVDIQQKDAFNDEWKKIRFHKDDIPTLIKALQRKIPEINADNYSEWSKEALNRC